MAKRRKKARKAAAKRRTAKASKRKVKAKAKPRKAARRKAKRRVAKPKQEGLLGSVVGAAEDAAALRSRMVGRDSFEDN